MSPQGAMGEGAPTRIPSQPWEEPGNLGAVQRRLLASAREKLQADLCTLFPLNPISRTFDAPPISVGEVAAGAPAKWALPRVDGITRRVLEEGLVVVEDLAREPEWESDFTRSQGIRSFAALAISSQRRRRPFAVLYIDYRSARRFSAADRGLLETFGREAASVLESTWQLARYQHVIRVGQDINQDLDSAENIFRKLDLHVGSLLDTRSFFMLGVYFQQSETIDLHFNREGHIDHQVGLALPPVCRRVIAGRQSLLISSFSDESGSLELARGGSMELGGPECESMIFVPLLFRKAPMGILSVQHSGAGTYDREDLHILELLGNHVASALAGIRLLDDLDGLVRAGQLLTDRLDPATILEDVAEQIRAVTKADLAILYPFHQDARTFDLPPCLAGKLLDAEFPQPSRCRPGDIPYLVVESQEPRFLTTAAALKDGLEPQEHRQVDDFQQREAIASVATTALRVGGETVGALFLNFRRRQPFDSKALRRLVEGLSVFAAIGIKNSRRLAAGQERRARELAVLQQIDRELNHSRDLGQVLQTILEGAKQIVAAEESAVLLLAPESGQLRVSATLGSDPPKHLDAALVASPKKGLGGWVLEHRESVLIRDVETESRWKPIFLGLRPGTRAEIDAPLLDGDRAIGLLNFESRTPGVFDEEDLRFVETLAGQVVVAISKAQDYERAERRAQERGVLIELSRQISGQLELDRLLDRVLEEAMKRGSATVGVILLYNERRRDLEVRVEHGTAQDNRRTRIPVDQGVVGRAATEGKTLNIDPTAPEWAPIYLAYASGSRAELAVPLRSAQRLWGVINIESRVPGRFDDSKVRLVEALADMAVVALQNAERFAEAKAGRRRMEALQSVSKQIIGQSSDPDAVMRDIVRQAVELTQAIGADLDLYEDGELVRTYLVMPGAQDAGAPKMIDLTQEGAEKPLRGLMAHVARTRQAYWTETDAREDPYFKGEPGVRSELAVPLLTDDQSLIGVLNVDSDEPFFYDEQSKQLLELFADEAVIAIQNALSAQRAERELQRFTTLVRVGQKLGEVGDWSQRAEACGVITGEAALQLRCTAVVRVHDALTHSLVRVRADGPGEIRLFDRKDETADLNGWVFKTRKPAIIDDAWNPGPDDPPVKPSDPATRSLYITPILLRDVYYGNLGLSHSKRAFFKDADRQLVDELARLLAITFHRLDSVQRQRELEERNKQAEVMASIGETSFGLAHRLSGDPGLMRSYVNNIRKALRPDGPVNEPVDRNLDRILSVADHTSELTDRIKQEVASFRLADPEPIRLTPLAEAIAHSLPIPPGVDLRLNPDEDLAEVFAIAEHVKGILEELLKNAFEAVQGGGRVILRATNRDRFVEVEIEDSGSGVEERLREKIFGFLFSTKDSSGFGLWSARKKARLNHGELWLAPGAPPHGATFVLSLPRADQRFEAEFAS